MGCFSVYECIIIFEKINTSLNPGCRGDTVHLGQHEDRPILRYRLGDRAPPTFGGEIEPTVRGVGACRLRSDLRTGGVRLPLAGSCGVRKGMEGGVQDSLPIIACTTTIIFPSDDD